MPADRIVKPDFHCHHTVTNEQSGRYDLHCHSHYEIYFFLSGKVSYLIEGRCYVPQPGSVLMIPPNAFHGVRVESSETYDRYAIHFMPSAIPMENQKQLLSVFADAGSCYYQNVETFHLPVCFEQILECKNLPESIQDMCLSITVQNLLCRILYMSMTVGNATPLKQTHPVVVDILQYLNENVTAHITLDGLSQRFFISKHHLNKIFRAATGTTVGDYMLHKRIHLARKLISEGRPPAQAGQEAGFQDYSAFYRAYSRILGHAPSKDKLL